MELIKENVNVCQTLCKGTAQSYVDEDIIVPDAKPDILQVLQIDATSCITNKKSASSGIEVCGRADIRLLYIPDSDREKIKSMELSFDFEKNIDCKDDFQSKSIIVTSNVNKVDVTLTNSRKLHIRGIVDIDYEVTGEQVLEIVTDTDQNDNVQVMRNDISLQKRIGECESEFSVGSTFEVPNGQNSICEILKVGTQITNSEYKSLNGKIVLKGEINVSTLYTDNNLETQLMENELSFTEVVDCENVSDETICDVMYEITQVNYTVAEDNDGDERIFEIQVSVRAILKATESTTIDMIRDCYEVRMKNEIIRDRVEIEEIVSRPSTQSTIRETFDISTNSSSVTNIYDVITKPVIKKCEVRDGKLLTEGKIETHILYMTDSSENPVCSTKKEMMFSFLLDCESDERDITAEVDAQLKHTAYNLNAAGEVEIRCVIAINAIVIRKSEIELISDVITENQDNKNKKSIVIYFVQDGDDLWGLGKRYAVEQNKLVEFNNIEKDAFLKVGDRLLIPSV